MSEGRNWVLTSVKDGGRVATEAGGCALQQEKTDKNNSFPLVSPYISGLLWGDAIHSWGESYPQPMLTENTLSELPRGGDLS